LATLPAACGSSSPPPAVLENADIPAALHLQQTQSGTAQSLNQVVSQTYPGCTAQSAVFTVNGRSPSPVLTGTTIYRQVFSESATCPSAAKAESVFQALFTRVKTFGATTVTGVGDAAFLTRSTSAKALSFDIFWRHGAILGSVQLSGPVADKFITVAETTVLARRQLARG
jgi:hypothetical protein